MGDLTIVKISCKFLILASSAGAGQKTKSTTKDTKEDTKETLAAFVLPFVSFVVSSWFISDAKAVERHSAFLDCWRLLLHQQNFFRAVHLG